MSFSSVGSEIANTLVYFMSSVVFMFGTVRIPPIHGNGKIAGTHLHFYVRDTLDDRQKIKSIVLTNFQRPCVRSQIERKKALSVVKRNSLEIDRNLTKHKKEPNSNYRISNIKRMTLFFYLKFTDFT